MSEAEWVNGRREGRRLYTCLDLKTRLYGTDRPSLEREVEIATVEATRLARDISVLDRLFPAGFGSLSDALAHWQQ